MPEIFVKMKKDGEIIEVHPLVVAAHEAVGWKQVVVEETPTLASPKSNSDLGEEESPAPKRKGK